MASNRAPIIIVLIIGAILLVPILIIGACVGFFALAWNLKPAAPGAPGASGASADGRYLPRESPYAVDYPNFDGKLADLAPAQVGRFRRTESSQALNLNDAKETWSAFYKSDKDEEIHLRIQQFDLPDEAYEGIVSDEAAAITTKIVRLEGYQHRGRNAGARALGRYRNDVKSVDAEAIWMTIGNLAIVIGSKDGLFAEEFLRDWEKQIVY